MKVILIRVAKYACALGVWLLGFTLYDLFMYPIIAWHVHPNTNQHTELLFAVALFTLCMSCAYSIGHRKSEKPRQAPDPRKWHLREDGEYSRVTQRVDGYVSYSPSDTHANRVFNEHSRKIAFRIGLATLAVSVFVFWAALIAQGEVNQTHSASAWQFIVMVLSGTFLLIGVLASIIGFPYRRDRIGPLPISPPGRRDVERQNVHGEGGFATRDEIDMAARDRSTGRTANDQTFYD